METIKELLAKQDVSQERLAEMKNAYECYQKVGGTVAYEEFVLIFLLREVEFTEYIRLLDRFRNAMTRTMRRAGQVLETCLIVSGHWETTPEDAERLNEIRDQLKFAITECGLAADSSPGDSVELTR